VLINTRQQLLLVVAIVGVALFVADKLILSPLGRSWKARSAKIVELRKSIARGTLLTERERPIRDRWENMITNMLPNNLSAAESEVLKAFDRWSQDSRISISSIKPQWKRPADDYMTLECRADAVGNMQALTRFLYDVEKDRLALRIEAIEISARDNDGQQLALGLQLSGLLVNPP